MEKEFRYTTLAHRYTARFPVLTYVGTQVNFWIIANILLVTIVHLYSLMLTEIFDISVAGNYGLMLLIAVILGLFYGVCMGLIGYYLDRSVFKRFPLGKIIVFKTLLSVVILVLLLWLVRLVVFNVFTSATLPLGGLTLNRETWDYLWYLVLIYYFAMTLLISFINQVNKKFGPGVLVPLLLGRYRTPKEDERIFLFMDLKSSTTTAEKLGHLRYSAFIRDCFADINEVLYPFYAQVYQYVGDEVVVMWPASEGLKDHSCLKFYFACRSQFRNRENYYMTNYGFLPIFKAGLHMGKVTVVEIGEIKREIAYHGDTLNTSARIQSVCNQYNRDFLVSKYLLEKAGADSTLKFEPLGMVLLKGKTEMLEIVSVEEN